MLWVSIVSELGRLAGADIDEPPLAVPVVAHRMVAEHIDQPDVGVQVHCPGYCNRRRSGNWRRPLTAAAGQNHRRDNEENDKCRPLNSHMRPAGSCVQEGAIVWWQGHAPTGH